jgi:histidinol-phosphate aminotransferase
MEIPDHHREGKLCLDMNENQWGPSPRVLTALSSLIENGGQALSAYGFHEELVGLLSARLDVPANEILITAGADEAISILFEAFRDPNDTVVLPSPTFVTFLTEANTTGQAIERIPYGADLRFPCQAFLAAMAARPRLAIIVNPNNPTGTAVEIDWIAELCGQAPDTLVIVDEAYMEYHGETVLSVRPRPANLAVIRTFSKAYALAGLRVAFVVAHPEIIASLLKVRTVFSVSTAGLVAARAAFDDSEFLLSHVDTLRKEMTSLVKTLGELGYDAMPTRANFILLRAGDEAGRLVAALAKRGILVSDRSRDPGLAGVLRIAVGRRDQNERLIGALEKEAESGVAGK